MANLPDLNPAEIGIIAFWNALDHWKGTGVQSIDPTDCIGVFSSYDVYDNGIEGYIDPKAKGWGGSGRHINVRVKSDGWMVAWIDRTNTYGFPNKEVGDFGENGHKGYYDILWDWLPYNTNISSTHTTLSYIINQLYNALSNKANFTFAVADVGHYCYEYPDANVITLMDKYIPPSSSGRWGYVQYTTGTTLYYAAVCGTVHNWKEVKFAGHHVAYTGHQGDNPVGVADIIAENWMPNPITDYALGGSTWSGSRYAHGSILIIWA